MRSRSSLWLVCGAAIPLGACSKKPAPAAQAAPTVVTITATDFAFSAPDTVPAGLVTLRLLSPSQEPHQAVVMRLDSGKTMADLQTMMMNPEAPIPAWVAFPIGVALIAPGDSGNATAVLAPGHYVMVCFIPSPDGRPHVAKGMVRPFEVVASGTAPAPEPEADITITTSDYDFALSTPLTAGTHTIRVENSGPQVHEVTVFQLAPGKTMADFQSWDEGGMRGPPPAKPLGGFIGPDVGGRGFFTATFAPGTYLLACGVPDAKDGKPHTAHGMIKEITIG